MTAAAPKGRPRGGSVNKAGKFSTNSKKTSRPAVPRRGPEAGDPHKISTILLNCLKKRPFPFRPKKLFPGNACFVFDKHRGDCFCRYGSLHKTSEFATVVDMCQLKT